MLHVERIGAGPVNTLDKAAVDPQVVHRKMVVEMEHALGGKIKHVGNPVKMPEIEEEHTSPPTLGQHNEDILAGLLGYSEDKIKRLREEEERHAPELLRSLAKSA